MGATILFADGSADARAAAMLAVERTDCTIIAAANGREALWNLTRRRPDMVLADVNLPGIDGIALAWHIRAWFPDVPILLMSGDLGEADLAQLRPLYDAILPRPVAPAKLGELAVRLAAELSRRKVAAGHDGFTARAAGS